jgi:ABC-type branched-subunit amino acid transport system substrate-binding protein
MRSLSWLLTAVLALPCTGAGAQIVVGQTSDFSGPAATGVKENTEGARLWLDHINRQGGVHGQRIQLVSLDDRFEPGRAVDNARTLITQHQALVLFLNRGTVHSEAMRPLLDEHGIALVAPSTGAMSLHKPAHPWIFNVRASYQREAEKSISLLASMGLTRIALVHVDDSAGHDVAAGAIKGFEGMGLQPAFVGRFDRVKPDFAPIARAVVRAEAQAVLLVGSAAFVTEGTKAIRALGCKAQIVTVSNNASDGFIKLMGPHARGTIVTQVFPNERTRAIPMVREATDLARAAGISTVSPAMLEGYAAAKVLAEGLKRAGPRPTRQKLRDALESLRRYDLGGLELGYGPGDHTGLDYTDLSIIDASGRFAR